MRDDPADTSPKVGTVDLRVYYPSATGIVTKRWPVGKSFVTSFPVGDEAKFPLSKELTVNRLVS